MVNVGGFVAAFAAFSWAIVYAFTQEILVSMNPLNLLVSTYVIAGMLSIAPFVAFGDGENMADSLQETSSIFIPYVVMVLIAKYCMISSVKMIGATAAGLIEISYVRSR